MTLLNGFAFAGYRSFSSKQPATLFPLRKVNLIAGQNNTGKSNILRVIAHTYGGAESRLCSWDRPLGDAEHTFSRLELHKIDEVLTWGEIAQLGANEETKIRSFLHLPEMASPSAGTDVVGFRISQRGSIDDEDLRRMGEAIGDSAFIDELSESLTRFSGQRFGESAYRIIRWITDFRPTAPAAVTVGGVRAISDENSEEPDLNGMSIKRRLSELQNPSTDRLEDKELFFKVQEFVRAVMDDRNITIDIPHDLSTIHVTQGGHTLPIENIGTGVHEVVILAAAATITQESIVCIEEPEVHLHPVLQRKLLRYLESRTTNQYFIATHSAHMLDSEIGSIFHVSRGEDGLSSVRYAGSAHDRAAVCADLGYRPSDLVQTNAVLWVEGPSDRIYLKHWIEQLAPKEFIEGTHYSIMFYGGSLLNALSPLDAEEVTEFISLRNLNRYMAILIDSDRQKMGAPLNESKRRVIKGLGDEPSTGVAWVTGGYTIENYVPEQILTNAISTVHPSTRNRKLDPQKQWENPLTVSRLDVKKPNKLMIAKVATENWANEWPLDLKTKVRKVIALIRAANSHT